MQPWALHEGAAQTLVRRLKYEGVGAVAGLAADVLVERLPASSMCLVPVPRALTRRIRYGIDPAATLASAVSARSGLPVIHALGPPLWNRPNAGSRRERRVTPRFVRRGEAVGGVLVDDVVTTGRTLDEAARIVGGVRHALTVTGVP